MLFSSEVVILDLNDFFKIGNKIQVISKERNTKTEYISQIAGVYNEFLDIFNPIYKGSLVYFRDGESVKIIIPKKEGVYEFDTVVLEKRYEKISIIRLKAVSELKKTQRRGYYRLKLTRTIKIKKSNDNDNENSGNYHEAILSDISGGGALFFAKLEMSLNDLVGLEIKIDEKNILFLKGIIKRKMFNIEKSFLFEYGVEFKNMKRSDRDTLIKFIFNEQRKLLKRGLS